MKRQNNAFTIVELLIVIVVISILAAITVVAYNGLQTRAKEAKLIATSDTLIKKANVKHLAQGVDWGTFGTPSTLGEVRNRYEIAQLANDVVVIVYDTSGNCISSLSDTCDFDQVSQRTDVVVMEIYTPGTTYPNGWTTCVSTGGVIISYPKLPLDIDADRMSTSVTSEGTATDSVGLSCSSVG